VLDEGRETMGTTALDAEPDVILRMPSDSYVPLAFALAMSVSFVGLLLQHPTFAGVGVILMAAALVAWLWPERRLAQTAAAPVAEAQHV